MKDFTRSSGVLLHPTSLPGFWGVGDIGPALDQFIDFLVQSGQSLWQILPLTIPDETGSPYAGFSAFASNPMLISPQRCLNKGWINQSELDELEQTIPDVGNRKRELLNRVLKLFMTQVEKKKNYLAFCEDNKYWLDDYALFNSLKKTYKEVWTKWPDEYKTRQPDSLSQWTRDHSSYIELLKFEQYVFFKQWSVIKEKAAENRIKIIGDIPIFISHDSVDVWAHQHLFKLDSKGNPTVVAGVPPDIFSKTGQHWGNPHYNWETLKKEYFTWWIQRVKHLLDFVDVIRLDHFRGFESAWEIAADAKTAEVGEWVKGKAEDLFSTLRKELGKLPIIAEDLGIITPEIEAIMENFDFPGMKIFQFAFDSDLNNGFLPHNYPDEKCVVYTGTHDNNTALGWYNSASELEKYNIHTYLQFDGTDVCWKMIQAVMESKARWAIVPLQDVLELDETGRMNFPGTSTGNWNWRLDTFSVPSITIDRLKKLTELSNRKI